MIPYGIFIPDPELDFLPIQERGVKRHRIPDPDPQNSDKKSHLQKRHSKRKS
jgi:hypothetical protein